MLVMTQFVNILKKQQNNIKQETDKSQLSVSIDRIGGDKK